MLKSSVHEFYRYECASKVLISLEQLGQKILFHIIGTFLLIPVRILIKCCKLITIDMLEMSMLKKSGMSHKSYD